jgi:thiamine-phosphate diphosphorylase
VSGKNLTPKQLFNKLYYNLYCFADNIYLCQKLMESGAKIIQLRAKKLPDDDFQLLAKEIMQLIRYYPETLLIVNDRVEIALQVQAHGIHIGQTDENFRDIIKRAPSEMIVGVSATNVEQSIMAEQAGATYIGAGAIFQTATKSDADVIGIEELGRIVKAITIPVVAIGGISIENIHQVIHAGAQYYAIISHINNAPDISKRIKEFEKIIAEAWFR